jgi:hypothetical protein
MIEGIRGEQPWSGSKPGDEEKHNRQQKSGL